MKTSQTMIFALQYAKRVSSASSIRREIARIDINKSSVGGFGPK
jgi:hypothetical protein